MNRTHRFATAAFTGTICALALAWPAAAGTVYVNDTTGNDAWTGRCETWDGATCGPKLTIQAGISAAIAGDTVLVADGTYTGAGNKNLDFAGKAITVRSASGNAATCIIDCQRSGRAFYFHTGEKATSKVTGLTLQNGLVTSSSPGSYYGGAVYCQGNSSPTLTNCMMSGNSATYGGAVACESAGFTLNACQLSGNATSQTGGAINGWSSACTLTDCTITGNTASAGGTVNFTRGSATLSACRVLDNVARGGGAIMSASCTLTLVNCVLAHNTATVLGGALRLWNVGDPGTVIQITNCTLAANSSPVGAGIVTGNASSAFNVTVNVANSILWDSGQEIANSGELVLSVTYSDVCGGWPGRGNIAADPLFEPAAPPLGGSQSSDGDFHLSAASPCINAGDNAAPMLPLVDFEGKERIQQCRVDIGADESPYFQDCNGNGVSDACEIADGTSTDCNNNGRPDACDIADGTATDADADGVPDACETPLRYVSASASPGGDGLSWSTAYNDLQSALIEAATLPGVMHEIWVAAGTYEPDSGTGDRLRTFQLVSGVAVYGGFTGHEASREARDPQANLTVLSGDLAANDATGFLNNDENSHHVVTGSGCDATAILDGFTIRGGNATAPPPWADGGGMYNSQGSPTVTNCVFVANAAGGSGGGMSNNDGSDANVTACRFDGNRAYTSGGGMDNRHSSPTITACTFTANQVTYLDAGAIGCYWSPSVTITDCTATGNTAVQFGGAFCFEGVTQATVQRCTLVANTAAFGGAVGMDASGAPTTASFADCVISGNTAQRGGAVAVWDGGQATLHGCMLSGNRATEYGGAIELYHGSYANVANCALVGNTTPRGGGVHASSACTVALTNCTIAGHQGVGPAVTCEYSTTAKSNVTARNCIMWDGGDEVRNNDSSTITVSYSDVQGGYAGSGNLDLDPLFVDADGADGIYGTADDDVHLLPTSPCIDAGDPASDFGLEPEPDGGRINMGAYGNTPEAETKGWIYIDAYHIARKTRVGRTLFEYDLTTTVRNASTQGVTNLVATLLTAPSNVQIIDGVVNVGDLPAGATVESTDTFTIRVDRATLVSPLPISWRVTYSNTFAEFTTLLDLGPPRLPGDLNCDGRVDFDDINPFVLALTGADGYYDGYPECNWLNADCNEDGSVDFDDINPFVELLTQ